MLGHTWRVSSSELGGEEATALGAREDMKREGEDGAGLADIVEDEGNNMYWITSSRTRECRP